MYNHLNLYSYRKLIFKKTFMLSLTGQLVLFLKIITLTHKIFQTLKNILIKFDLKFELKSFRRKEIKIEFQSFNEIKKFLYFCFSFKIIPYFFTPFFIVYNNKKISFFKIYNYLNFNKTKLDIYKLILQKLCRNLLFKLYFLNSKIFLKCPH